MKKIIILCGLPRSGKSTWVRKNRTNEVVISADQLRLLIYNKSYWQEGESLVWSIREVMLKAIMQQGLDIIIDETNITKKSRAPIIKLAKKHGYHVIVNVVEIDPETCKQRVRDEYYFIEDNPEYWDCELLDAIDRMIPKFEIPSADEDFDEFNMI